jgi:predicted ABC-type ATPase
MDENVQPAVIVIAGANGSGKSTSARTLLAERLRLMTFVNADLLAQGLAAFDPASAALDAGRIMLDRLQELSSQRLNFAFETTLAARSFAPQLKNLRDQGYVVFLYYFWLQSADLAVARVAERVKLGGHDVPESTIRRRYARSVENFFCIYRGIVPNWEVYDNSEYVGPRLIAWGDTTGDTVLDQDTWTKFQKAIEHD